MILGVEPKKISSQLKAFVNAENTAVEDVEVNSISVLLESAVKNHNVYSFLPCQGIETTWHVVSSAWVASWLAHVRLAKGKSPAPGPCRNDGEFIGD